MDLLKSVEWKQRRRCKPKQHKEKSIEELALDVAKQKGLPLFVPGFEPGRGAGRIPQMPTIDHIA